MDILKDKILILASKSPRRHELLNLADIPHIVKTKEVEEVFPHDIPTEEVAMWLSGLKASVFTPAHNEIVLTADTIVLYQGEILGKPKDEEEARQVIAKLSGSTHEVITGFTLKSPDLMIQRSVTSLVTMNELSAEEILYYVGKYKPLDKAGSYGIQEWIGFAKICNINGSYANIMGLPVHEVYSALQKMV